MGKLSTYDIAYRGLKEGLHEFNYEIDAKFFERFEGSLVGQANISVKVIFEKRSALLSLSLKVKGTVELICDRCLEKYYQPIKQKASVFIKFGEKKVDEGDDFFWVPPEEYHINIAQLLYEYIVLSIPIRHAHPEKVGKNACTQEMLKKIKSYSKNEMDENTDERWDALRKLKKNN